VLRRPVEPAARKQTFEAHTRVSEKCQKGKSLGALRMQIPH
jgi:hypothetical protein